MKKHKKPDALPQAVARPITIRTFVIDWEARTISMDGRVRACPEHRYLHIPILDTDKMIVPRSGEVW